MLSGLALDPILSFLSLLQIVSCSRSTVYRECLAIIIFSLYSKFNLSYQKKNLHDITLWLCLMCSRLFKNVVNPVIYKYWTDMQAPFLQSLPSRLKLTGDGQVSNKLKLNIYLLVICFTHNCCSQCYGSEIIRLSSGSNLSNIYISCSSEQRIYDLDKYIYLKNCCFFPLISCSMATEIRSGFV
jgi:hypothetical protein